MSEKLSGEERQRKIAELREEIEKMEASLEDVSLDPLVRMIRSDLLDFMREFYATVCASSDGGS